MSEQDDILFATSILNDAFEPQRARLQAEYDGINGKPPAWVPKHYCNDFYRLRGRLLDDRGYTHDALMVWLDRYRDHFLLDTETDESLPLMRKYPNGQPLDRLSFMDEIGLLAWLRWCVFDIDKKTAKEQLDVGFSIANAADKGRDNRNKKYKEIEDFFIKTADGIWTEYHNSGKRLFTVPEMATKIINSCPYDVEQETAEKYLRKAKIAGKISVFSS